MEIDILNIDKTIREKWKLNDEKLKEIDKQIIEIQDILKDDMLSVHIVKDLKDNIYELEKTKKEWNDIQTNMNLHFYIMEVTPILEEYKKILTLPKKMSFMSKKDNDQQQVRIIVKSYLDILKQYNIDYGDLDDIVSKNNKSPVKRKECKYCKSTQGFIFNEYNNVEICENCGKQEEKSFKTSSYKDISRVNISNKYKNYWHEIKYEYKKIIKCIINRIGHI
jgi:hypothetical protein